MAEKMIGAGLKDIDKPAGRGVRRAKSWSSAPRRAGRRAISMCRSRTSASPCMPARSSASPAWPATGRTRCCWRSAARMPRPTTGAITLDGEPIGTLRRQASGACKGLARVPEERNGHAAVPDFSLSDNSVLTARDRLGHGRLRADQIPGGAKTYTGKVIAAFAVKAQGPAATAGSLSGGNLQKYIMGREILQKPEVLVVSQPTWGVDAGAAAAIHQAHRRSGGGGLGHRRHLPGSRRTAGALRHAGGDQRGAAVASR